MKNCLILITSSYPYLTQESFIESEIPFDAAAFDKVITLAVDVGKNAPKMRAVPENVDSFNVSVTSKKLGRGLSKVKGVFNYIKGTDYDESDAEADTVAKKLFLGYFVARAEREFVLCMDKLKEYDFSEYDSVTVYSYWFFVSALIGVKIKEEVKKQCGKVKLVSRAHGYDVYESRDVNRLNYLPLRAYLLNKFDAVYVCSENGRDHIRQRYPVFANKVHKSYLGTTDNGISGTEENCIHILSCSNVIALKRVDRIANSLSLLKDKGIENIKWTHIGDGVEMPVVKDIVDRKLDFMEVEFKGNIKNSDVLSYCRKNPVDLFINVSNSEGLPVSIMEAMSFGIPVIAADVGGVSEIVKNNFNGRLISKDFEDDDLAFEIKRFYGLSPEEKAQMRENARIYWEENFNAEKNYTNFVNNII